MPDATLATFGLEGKQASELEQRRQAIVDELQHKWRGFDDPNVPIEILTELSVITGALRAKTAKPPKTAKQRKPATEAKAPKATLDSIFNV